MGRVRKGVRAALLITVVYGIGTAVAASAVLRPALGVFFSGDVDINVMMPWARTYMNICAVFFVPLGTIFVFRNIMQGCGYGLLPMLGGVVELVARLTMAFAAMAAGSYAMACICHPVAWTSAAVFLGVSCWRVLRPAGD